MSKIDWTDETLNFLGGCTKVSPGCDNCYAEIMALRLAHIEANDPDRYPNYMNVVHVGTRKWNSKIFYNEQVLYKPLSWKKPRMIFVCSMGDLFHEEVPTVYIDRLMAIIASTPHHTYQILTKRPERMASYFDKPEEELVQDIRDACYDLGIEIPFSRGAKLPLSNMWLGVTAENQEQLVYRVPVLIGITAAKRFISIEPMLSQITLFPQFIADKPIDWIIVGGETGHKARPVHPDWVRSIRDQCVEASIPFFFKQWGEWYPDKKGIYKDARCLHFGDTVIHRIGKKNAGHMIDGKEWREMP